MTMQRRPRRTLLCFFLAVATAATPNGAAGAKPPPAVEARPLYRPTGDFHAVRFDGRGSHLRLSGMGLSLPNLTVFVVAAPYSCPEPFSAFLSALQRRRSKTSAVVAKPSSGHDSRSASS